MSRKNTDAICVCAYVALVLAGILIVICNLLPLVGIKITGAFVKVLTVAKDLALLIGIGVPAYNFAAGTNKKFWIVTYWIALALFVAGVIFGLFD